MTRRDAYCGYNELEVNPSLESALRVFRAFVGPVALREASAKATFALVAQRRDQGPRLIDTLDSCSSESSDSGIDPINQQSTRLFVRVG